VEEVVCGVGDVIKSTNGIYKVVKTKEL